MLILKLVFSVIIMYSLQLTQMVLALRLQIHQQLPYSVFIVRIITQMEVSLLSVVLPDLHFLLVITLDQL